LLGACCSSTRGSRSTVACRTSRSSRLQKPLFPPTPLLLVVPFLSFISRLLVITPSLVFVKVLLVLIIANTRLACIRVVLVVGGIRIIIPIDLALVVSRGRQRSSRPFVVFSRRLLHKSARHVCKLVQEVVRSPSDNLSVFIVVATLLRWKRWADAQEHE
jgi:hypothetical protein